jgi:effector-binding domain-containing protein
MSEPSIVTLEPATVAVLSMTGSFAQIPEGYGRLYGYTAAHGLQPVGMPSAVYLTMPDAPEADAVWELWAPVAGDVPEAEADESGIAIRHVPGHEALSVMHVGPYDSIPPTYAAAMQWMAARGYRMAGPPMERYYSDPAVVPPEEYLTEVLLPVSKVG